MWRVIISMNTSISLCILVLPVQVLCAIAAGIGAGKITRQVPAVFVLGDSLVDVGNNNYLAGENVPRANMPYFGIDDPTSRPTGRFSNDYNIADFIAKAVGFNESPPAYLSLAANSNALVSAAVSGGINYASGAAGILDSTSAGRTIPLRKQVQYLESTKVQIETKLGSRATANLISTSFYLLEIGQNDLSVFSQSQSRDGDDVAAFYATVISNYSAVITDLYKMGARKFAVINVSPIGCLPVARLLNNTGGCIGSLNKLSLGLDHSIKTMLENLSCKLRGLAYSLGDIYSHTLATLQDPKAFGYVNIGSACCGNGRLNAESVCLPNSTLCTNRDGFFYWDRVHPSERAAHLATAAFYDGPSRFTTPINFKQLAAAKKKKKK